MQTDIICEGCALATKQRSIRYKREALDKYGGICACCGEEEIEFLTIDHINNDGAEKRRSGEHGQGNSWYVRLRREPIDPSLQVLCWNCNMGKRISGVCPHKDPSYCRTALSRGLWKRNARLPQLSEELETPGG